MDLVTVSNLRAQYNTPTGPVTVLDDISFTLQEGQTVGLVGESGCGKSTLGKTLLGLIPPVGGEVTFRGQKVSGLTDRAMRPHRRRMQMVFQDPFGSLNPRHSIRSILVGPLKVYGHTQSEQQDLAEHIIERVGLPKRALDNYPHEFSGGQRQRIGIARALILQPELVVCDEPVSALDLSVQAQILNLLSALKAARNLAYLFISHDLSVVRYFTDRTMVMYLGRIVESAPSDALWRNPRHPYTRALIDALPDPSRRRHVASIKGDIPSVRNLPNGCRFNPRCPLATDICRQEEPRIDAGQRHGVACHYPAPPH